MADQSRTEVEIDAMMYRARMPAIAMLPVPRDEQGNPLGEGTPGCRLGGAPSLPPEYEWPTFTFSERPFEGVQLPMQFVLQMNLQYLPRVIGLPELPPKGTLFVFYEPISASMPWSFKDRTLPPMLTGDCVRLIYHPDEVSDEMRRPPPQMPDVSELVEKGFAVFDEDAPPLADEECSFDYFVVDTFKFNGPNAADGWRAIELSEKQSAAMRCAQGWDRYDDPRGVGLAPAYMNLLFGAPHHLGPSPTRENFDQLGAHHFPALADDYVRLFRLPYAMIAWGDQILGYWIHREDLAKSDFSKILIWMEDL